MRHGIVFAAVGGLAIALPSFGVIGKFLGGWVVPLYGLLITAIVGWAAYPAVAFVRRLSVPAVFLIAATGLLVWGVVFGAVYPRADAGVWAGGSDRDEDCDIVARSLLARQYPYGKTTYLGNTLTHLPGSGVLAAPFVLLGDSAYQNFFWLAVFFIWSGFFLKSWRLGLLPVATAGILSPVVTHEIITGGDLVANSLYVLIALYWCGDIFSRQGASTLRRFLAAAFLGIALSSRLNYLLTVPLLCSFVYSRAGAGAAARCVLSVLFFFAAITLPFYAYDPQGFSPLPGQLAKLRYASGGGVLSGAFLLAGVVLVSCALSLRRMKSEESFFAACAFCLAVPVIAVVVLDSFSGRAQPFGSAGYGLTFLFFACVALVRRCAACATG